jgi:hypothetical protein
MSSQSHVLCVFIIKKRDGHVHGKNPYFMCLNTCNKKINHLIGVCSSPSIQAQHHWGVFLQHYPRQKNHELIFLASLMKHI